MKTKLPPRRPDWQASLRDLIRPWFRLLRPQPVPEAAKRFQSLGEDCVLPGNLQATPPTGIALGERVRLGEGMRILAHGGVQIRDGAKLGRWVDVESSCQLPEGRDGQVIIGRGARIGNRARLLPGTVVEDGARVPPGREVSGRVRATGRAPSPFRRETPRLCFVLTSGRSGSTSLAAILGQHPGLHARHEPRLQLIRWATQFAHGEVTREDMRERLDALYRQTSVFAPGLVHVEIDQKLVPLAGLLGELFPQAKFVSLQRDGRDVVASCHARGWYRPEETDPEKEDEQWISWQWRHFRLQGDRCGDVSPGEWAAMSPFGKCCWYWAGIQRRIRLQQEQLPPEQFLEIKLENLEADLPALQDFLGVKPRPLEIKRTNRARQAVTAHADWSDGQKQQFDDQCGEEMDRLYPGWRQG